MARGAVFFLSHYFYSSGLEVTTTPGSIRFVLRDLGGRGLDRIYSWVVRGQGGRLLVGE